MPLTATWVGRYRTPCSVTDASSNQIRKAGRVLRDWWSKRQPWSEWWETDVPTLPPEVDTALGGALSRRAFARTIDVSTRRAPSRRSVPSV